MHRWQQGLAVWIHTDNSPVRPVLTITLTGGGTTGVSWALLVYMQNCQPTLLVIISNY